ncbi:hypothetical protein EXT49_03160 [Pectobacterium polaris]|uniref:hypothetical protein n=1 Tax=Pectobacterium polaris TaxID=2042057 RepID=UPI002031073C|nr:hypothetical protein [Pectobacterium polaris]MCL6359042.1 hypothetical protein [Pectobacterium polaris]
MSKVFGPGPYKILKTHDGQEVPFYIVSFDKFGSLLSRETERELIEKATEFSDIFLFSHGWNNDWSWATQRYENFFEEYSKLRKNKNISMPDTYKPMMIGVFWPSTALVFGESERGPVIKGKKSPLQEDDYSEDQYLMDINEVAEFFEKDNRENLYALIQDDNLSYDNALRLAELVLNITSDSKGEKHTNSGEEKISAQEIVDIWIENSQFDPPPYDANAQIMGQQIQKKNSILTKLDPRQIIRLLTVAIMKDRAGTVGYNGVGVVLQKLLDKTGARIHLIGHSYGAKVVLSALSATSPTSRNVHSALLLQPAISYLAFAEKIPKQDWKGGYHTLLNRVNAPILSTFSSHDIALHTFFHRALRRKNDLGEHNIKAAGNPSIPNIYAALGGYGPQNSGENIINLQPPGNPYELNDNIRIYGLNGSVEKKIGGHGDIISPYTAWALYTLVTYKMAD